MKFFSVSPANRLLQTNKSWETKKTNQVLFSIAAEENVNKICSSALSLSVLNFPEVTSKHPGFDCLLFANQTAF